LLFQEGPGNIDLVSLDKGIANGMTLGNKECVSHAATDDQGVDFVDQVLDNADFVGDLGTAQNGDEGAFRIVKRTAHDVELFLDQVAADSRQVVSQTCGRGVGAVGGAKCIIDKNIGQRGQFAGK